MNQSSALTRALATAQDPPLVPPRVKVVFEEDSEARFEECHGQSRPLTRTEYAQYPYMGCPAKHHAGSVPDSTRPHTGYGRCAQCAAPLVKVSYADYRAYYGNPSRHRYLVMVVYTLGPDDDDWQLTDSLGNIDFMDDDDAEIGTFYRLDRIRNAYQRDLAQGAGLK